MIVFRIYDVPEDKHPKRKAFTNVISKINSFVNEESSNKSHPTWKPTHIEHLKSSPNIPRVGRSRSKIDPYTVICVSP